VTEAIDSTVERVDMDGIAAVLGDQERADSV
jgi:hypothetical protein